MKKQRTDSAKGAVTTMAGAMTEIKVPDWVCVPDKAMDFWKSITSARAADRWNNADLECAAELARTKYNIERLNTELIVEGDTIKNERGTMVVNPKHNLLETLTRRVVALSRMLQVHAEATQGKSNKQVPANKAQTRARKTMSKVSSLIPRPN